MKFFFGNYLQGKYSLLVVMYKSINKRNSLLVIVYKEIFLFVFIFTLKVYEYFSISFVLLAHHGSYPQ